MSRTFIVYISTIILVIGLPLLGLTVSGQSILSYLTFPPSLGNVDHAPFSLPIFVASAHPEIKSGRRYVFNSEMSNFLQDLEDQGVGRPADYSGNN